MTGLVFDRSAAEKFLAIIGRGETKFCFQCFDDDKERVKAHNAANEERRERGEEELRSPFVRVLNGTLAQYWNELTDLNERGAGVFVTVNETNGRGRTTKDIVKVRALFLDLDGNPLAVDEKEPHVIVETSPCKWHEYWLVDDVPLDGFTPRQKALIARHGGDKVVHDLPRVMRLPGFFHRKTGQARLVKIIRVNELPEYHAADFPTEAAEPHEPLDGDPITADGAVAAALAVIPTPSNDADDWDQWCNFLMAIFRATGGSEEGWELPRGWSTKLPTNSEAATEKKWREIKQYSPPDRIGFGTLRYHAFRANPEWRTLIGTPFTAAVEIVDLASLSAFQYEQKRKGAARRLGQRLVELDKLVEALRRPQRTDEPPLRREAKANEAGIKIDDFLAYMPMGNFIFRPTREMWPATSVDARVPPVFITNADGEEKMIAPSYWLRKNAPVDQMIWAPGKIDIIPDRFVANGGWIDKPGARCLNTYRPPKPFAGGDPALAEPWLRLVEKIYPTHVDDTLDRFAHRIQKPYEKINHILLLGGEPGIGKDSMIEPLRRAVGPHNFTEVTPVRMMNDTYNKYLVAVVLRINEAHDLGDLSRYSFYEHLKVIAASPPPTFEINEKYINQYIIFNCVFVVMTTNYRDGLYLPANDRRTYAMWSSARKEDFKAGYFVDYWRWLDAGGDGHVAAYLASRDISKFDPAATPPRTAAFRTIVALGAVSESNELMDALDAMGNPDVVTVSDVIEFYKSMTDLCAWFQDKKNGRAIPHRFDDCGYVQYPNPNATNGSGVWKIAGQRRIVYVRRDLTTPARALADYKKAKAKQAAGTDSKFDKMMTDDAGKGLTTIRLRPVRGSR
jgi:RepB DNA-primase from phage plasmid/Primase C terminal 2 (PriCT-2)